MRPSITGPILVQKRASCFFDLAELDFVDLTDCFGTTDLSGRLTPFYLLSNLDSRFFQFLLARRSRFDLLAYSDESE